jgi:hypothetical protein
MIKSPVICYYNHPTYLTEVDRYKICHSCDGAKVRESCWRNRVLSRATIVDYNSERYVESYRIVKELIEHILIIKEGHAGLEII